MESLDYLYLALAKLTTASTGGTTLKNTGERKPFASHKSSHLSTTVNLLAVTIALCVLGMARQASALVEQGDRGTEVAALQERLQELGYFKANVTGYYGGITKDAVRQFQKAQGLTPDGVVGEKTQAALEEKVSEQTEDDSPDRILQLGDRGEAVSALQKRLAYAGYFAGKQGIFDEETQEAVRQFQQAKALVVDGIAGQQTLAALPKVGDSNSTPASKQAPVEDKNEPIIKNPEPTPESTDAPLWYEDQSAPLQPFIR